MSGGWFRSSDTGLVLASGGGAAEAVGDLGMRAGAGAAGRGRRAIAAADTAPRVLTLTHYDPARDYQSGVQRASRPGAGNREARMELPAAIDASAAKTLAEAGLARLDVERERRSVALGWDRLAVAPGARVTIAGAPGLWRVDRWALEAMVLTLDCVAVAPAALAASASGGRVLGAPDLVAGETIVHAFELPPLDEVAASAPRLAIAAAGTAAGWRSAALLTSSDGGAQWSAVGATAPAAVLGHVAIAPGAAPAALEDRSNRAEVTLAHAGMTLADADAAALDAGANLAMLGDELIQFGRAEPLGVARWRLGRLWRGRRGTEAAIGGQAPGGPLHPARRRDAGGARAGPGERRRYRAGAGAGRGRCRDRSGGRGGGGRDRFGAAGAGAFFSRDCCRRHHPAELGAAQQNRLGMARRQRRAAGRGTRALSADDRFRRRCSTKCDV